MYALRFGNGDSFSVHAEKAFWLAGSLIDPITDFFTQGLADFLCLDTLRHGTSWRKYLNIRVYGADPNQGGVSAAKLLSEAENTDAYVNNSKGFFCVFRDNVGKNNAGRNVDVFKRFDAYNRNDLGMGVVREGEPELCQKIKGELFVRFGPRFYAWEAGCAESDSPCCRTAAKIASGIFNIFAPTVKFYFKPEDVSKKFEDDPLMIGSAIRTKEPIGTDHLGLRGIFVQGCDGNVCKRISAHPGKALWGLIRLINPIGILLLLALGLYLIFRSTPQRAQIVQ